MTTKWPVAVMLFFTGACGPTHKDPGAPLDGNGVAIDGSPIPTDTDNGSNGSATCTLNTCTSQNAMCGPIGDGCGGLAECGSCTSPET